MIACAAIPTPSGLVSTRRSPARARGLQRARAPPSTVPITAQAVLELGIDDGVSADDRRSRPRPPCRARRGRSAPATSIGEPRRAESRRPRAPPAARRPSRTRRRARSRPRSRRSVSGSSTIGVMKSTVKTRGGPDLRAHERRILHGPDLAGRPRDDRRARARRTWTRSSRRACGLSRRRARAR